MAKRTAKDFSRSQIYEIANKYSTTDASYSCDYFSREYEISRGTFYCLLEKAVIENIVDLDVVKAIAIKAAYNSETKAGKTAKIRSENHYWHLIKKREVYMLPKKDAIDWTIKYSKSPLTKKAFASNNHISTKLIDRTLMKAIIENWVEDDILSDLKRKSIKANPEEKTMEFWENIEKYREKNENKQGQG